MKVRPSFSPKSLRTAIVLVLIVLSHIRQPIPVFAQATTLNINSISITPANAAIRIGDQTTLLVTAAFSDGSSRSFGPPGVWDILFSPQIDISSCPPLPAGAPVFASQQVTVTSTGSFHRIWGTPQDVTADGTKSDR